MTAVGVGVKFQYEGPTLTRRFVRTFLWRTIEGFLMDGGNRTIFHPTSQVDRWVVNHWDGSMRWRRACPDPSQRRQWEVSLRDLPSKGEATLATWMMALTASVGSLPVNQSVVWLAVINNGSRHFQCSQNSQCFFLKPPLTKAYIPIVTHWRR